MKKTVTVNLNGRIFNIDEDAYQLLDKYLRNLRHSFRKVEGNGEILADFEARIEELLSDKVRPGRNVISLVDVEEVIDRMGRPGDFDESETEPTEEKAAPTSTETESSIKKKFYRNPDDKKLGGLCSGLAAYFGWDVTAVRIIAAILIFVSSLWIIPVYLIAWLLVPEAITAEQKLEMQGKPITVENIGKMVSGGLENARKSASGSGFFSSIIDFIVVLLKVCLIGLGAIVGIMLVFFLVALIIVLFCVLFGVQSGILGGFVPWTESSFLVADHLILATSAFCLILGIPLVALVYTFVSFLFKLKPMHPGVKWAGLVLWIAALVAFPFSGFNLQRGDPANHRGLIFGWSVDRKSGLHGNGVAAERIETFEPIRYIRAGKRLTGVLRIEQAEGNTAQLSVEGDSNLIDKIIARVKDNGTLDLSISDLPHFRPTLPFTLCVRTPDLRGVEVLSVGNVVVGSLRADDFSIQMKGLGAVYADSLHVGDLKVEINSAGLVQLGGLCRIADLEVDGVGKIRASELVADSVRAEVDGIGAIWCNPVDYLHGCVDGLGAISYKSEPRSKETNVRGMGKIGLN
jgi:phage shock protein PspC (stress-responsive transcriptional regulator)